VSSWALAINNILPRREPSGQNRNYKTIVNTILTFLHPFAAPLFRGAVRRTEGSIINSQFLEQRAQSDACISYAESRQNWAKPIFNFQFSIFNFIKMSKKININWNMVAQGIMTLIATLASAITLNSCIHVL